MKTVTITLWQGEEKKHSWVYVNKEQGISFYIPKKIVGEENPPLALTCTLSEQA
jgi:hypothetical protein